MLHGKRVLKSSVLVFSISVLFACATPNSGNVKLNDGVPVGYKYYAKFPADLNSLEAVKKDLEFFINGNKKRRPAIKYHGEPSKREDLIKFLGESPSDKVKFYYSDSRKDRLLYMLFTNIAVWDDCIEFGHKINLFYTDLTDMNIIVEKGRYEDLNIGMGVAEVGYPRYNPKWYAENYDPEMTNRFYMIPLPGIMTLHFIELADGQRFADNLFFIQQNISKYTKEKEAIFQQKAAQYRSLKIKPPVSEEQRKFIVQANALNQEKNYKRAIELYQKAVEVDPVSYPGAYFNTALLYAQMKRFNMAIFNMKKYLLLVPEAKDARTAQDKIYEWEIKLKK